jgi:bacterioferritin (cytochrome b1)
MPAKIEHDNPEYWRRKFHEANDYLGDVIKKNLRLEAKYARDLQEVVSILAAEDDHVRRLTRLRRQYRDEIRSMQGDVVRINTLISTIHRLRRRRAKIRRDLPQGGGA